MLIDFAYQERSFSREDLCRRGFRGRRRERVFFDELVEGGKLCIQLANFLSIKLISSLLGPFFEVNCQIVSYLGDAVFLNRFSKIWI